MTRVNATQTSFNPRFSFMIDCLAAALSQLRHVWTATVVVLVLSISAVEASTPEDLIPPAVTISSHSNGATVSTKTITLQGTATDAGRGNSGISSVYAKGFVPNSKANGAETITWSQTIALNPGANHIDVYAYDNSPQQNYTTYSMVINFQPLDTLSPLVEITSHQNGQIVNTKSIRLSGRATDANRGNNGISSVYVRGTVRGTAGSGSDIVPWSQDISLNPGANHIEVYAYDNSDVQNSRIETITINFQPVDALPPLLTVTSHTNGQTVASSTITLQGTATDSGRGNSGISSVYVRGTVPGVNAAGGDSITWSKTVDLYPGVNRIDLYAYDNSDVQNYVVQTLTINFEPADLLAPILTVTSHTNGQTVFTSSITLKGTASDAGRGDQGISSVYVRGSIPNARSTGGEAVSWSKTIDLSPGANYIEVSAYDDNQFPNVASQSLVINFQAADTLGPSISISSHADGQQVKSSSITLAGTVTDAGRGDSGISEISVQGRLPDVRGTGAEVVSWSKTLNLNPGANNITVYASDNSPFPSSSSTTITIHFTPEDLLPPNLSITSHTNDQVVFSSPIVLAGRASDANRGNNGISNISVNFAKITNAVAPGAETIEWNKTLSLKPGRNILFVSATDNAPFPQSTNQSVTIYLEVGDIIPPRISITSHKNNETVRVPTVILSGEASDSGAGDSGIDLVSINDSPITDAKGAGGSTVRWSKTLTLNQGVNFISVLAKDSRGNSAVETLSLNYVPDDLLPPIIEIASHKNQQVVTTSSILLAGTATDAGNGASGIAKVTVNEVEAEDGTAVGSAHANWSQSVSLKLGLNVLSVVAIDQAGNSAASTISVVYEPVDKTPPVLEITSHKKGEIVSKNTIILAGAATDALRGDNGVASVTVNGIEAENSKGIGAGIVNWSAKLTLDLGINVISVVAQDTLTNSEAQTILIDYNPSDVSPPMIEVLSHKSGQRVGSSTIILSGTATDDKLGNNGVSGVTVNGKAVQGGIVSGGEIARWSVSLQLQPGDNVISILAQDNSPERNSAAHPLVLHYDPGMLSGAARFCWSAESGGKETDSGNSVAVDPQGNSYVTGVFSGSATFGSTNLLSRGASDVFLAKWNSSGTLLWVKQAGGILNDAGNGIALDEAGNCYITGYFQRNATFENVTLTNNGDFDLFLAKYDASGQLLWARASHAENSVYASAVGTDHKGNVFVTGAFINDAKFGDEVFSNDETYDVFLARYGADGELIWARQAGGIENDQAFGIALDKEGNCFITGYFEEWAIFDETELEGNGTSDLFVAKYSPEGALIWAMQGGGSGATQGFAIGADSAGNSYVTGYFEKSAKFGDRSLTSSGFFDLFLAKYDREGSLLWAKNTETSSAINAAGLAVDPLGNSYITGSFVGPAVFQTIQFTNDELSNLFVSSYDTQGNLLWAKSVGGEGEVSGFDIAVDLAGNSYVVGSLTGTGTLGTRTIVSAGKGDVFTAKLPVTFVQTPIQLSYQVLSDGKLVMTFDVDPCHVYSIQASEDLEEWVTLQYIDQSNESVRFVDPDSARFKYRFYRVVSE